DRITDLPVWKLQRRVGLDGAHVRSGHLRIKPIHGECGRDDDDLILRFEISFADEVEGFVHTVGQQDGFRRQLKVSSDNAFHMFALRIFGEAVGSNLREHSLHAGRWGEGVFVEVEAKPFAPGERRVILVNLLDGGTRTQFLRGWSGFHLPDLRRGLADSLRSSSRIRTDAAWAVRPSAWAIR